MSGKDVLFYAAVGFSVWLNGAVTFYFGGKFLFESGPWVTALVALFITVAICMVFRGTMQWRRADPKDGVTIAVVMILPELFGEAARQLVFNWATGLTDASAPVFSATIFFANAVLLTYAVMSARRAR